MAEYEVTYPDGSAFRVTGPEGMSPSQVEALVQAQRTKTPTVPTFGEMHARGAGRLAEYDPTHLTRGVVRGAQDIAEGVAQLGLRGAEAAGIEAAEPYRERLERFMETGEKEYLQEQAGAPRPAIPSGLDVPRLAGAVGATAPIAYAVPNVGAGLLARGAVGGLRGAAAGAAQPVAEGDFWPQKAVQAGIGAGAGMVAGGLTAPKRAETSLLRREGVTPTPGQMRGGAAQRFEEGIGSIPFLGDIANVGRRRAVLEFNTAAIRRAVKPIGGNIPKGSVGHNAVIDAGEQLSKAYDDLVPRLNGKVDQRFYHDMTRLVREAGDLTDDARNVLTRHIQLKILPKIKGGQIDGADLKNIESTLGDRAAKLLSGPDPDMREAGSILREIQFSLRQMLARHNPQHAARLKSINRGYANLLRVERAAGSSGAAGGVFTPAQLRGAVRTLDRSRNKRAFARGKALMQDLADAGTDVLGAKVPDSGTPYRAAAGLAALGGVGYGAQQLDPRLLPAALGAGATMGAMYSPVGQRVLAGAMTRHPAGLSALLSPGLRLPPM